CHVYGRGKGQAQMIPGWPYSVVAALEPGRTSWTAVLDAIRLGPDDDEAEVTAAQVREVITRLIEAGARPAGGAPGRGRSAAGGCGGRWCSGWGGWPGGGGRAGAGPCLWKCWGGCALTGCCTSRCRPASPAPTAGHPATAGSSPSRTRPPGQTRPWPRPRRPP